MKRRSPGALAERTYLRMVEAYQSAILNYIYRLVGDAAVAEDLTQDTYVKAWRALERLELEDDAEPRRRAWLYRIAHNTATDHLRKRGRLRWLSLDAWRDDGRPEAPPGLTPTAHRAFTAETLPEPVGEDPDPKPELRAAVHRALARLSDDHRQALLLFNHVGMSADEVAEVLGIQPAAARKRRQRAREAFEAAWRDVGGDAEVEFETGDM